jgi:hypothetical protein
LREVYVVVVVVVVVVFLSCFSQEHTEPAGWAAGGKEGRKQQE